MDLKHSIPRLRFKEYNDQYKSIILGDHTSWSSGGTPPKDNPDYWNGDIPWISASSMRGNVYSDSELKLSFNGVKKGSKIAVEGSLLILVRGSMLFNCIPIGIVGRDLAFNQDVKSIFPSEILDNWFLLYWFKSHEPQLMNIVTGTGIGAGKLDLSDLKGLKLSIPSVREQQKIASFLSTVDEKIQLLKKQQAHLELYKKGVMQKIFSRELRFKDENGKDFPEWKEQIVNDIFTITRGYVLSVGKMKQVQTSEYCFPVFSSQTKNGGLCGYYNEYLFEDAITWTTDGANAGEVNFRMGKFYCTNVCGVLINKDGYANKCVAEILNSITHKFVSYVGNPKLMNNTMGGIKITIPSSLQEQQKIASFLSALDEKIDHCKEQIRLTEEWKKGLLQQMFV